MKRVCMVVYAYYPQDPRVRKEAETLARNGYEVDVVSLREPGQKPKEAINGVNAIRLPLSSAREGGKLRYVYQYMMFFLLAETAVELLHSSKKYCVIHTNSVPDFIVYTAMFPKLFGAKVILDLHEGMPEIYLSRLGTGKSDSLYRLFVKIERASAKYAHRVITVSDYLADIFAGRGTDREKITVIYNVPKVGTMSEPANNAAKSIVFTGNLNDYNDFDTVLDAVSGSEGVSFHVYGDGIMKNRIEDMIGKLRIEKKVILHGWKDSNEIISKLGSFGAGLVAFADTPITRVALGNKVFEYSAAGLPVIAPRLPALESVFDDSCLFYFKPGDNESLSEAIGNALAGGEEVAKRVRNCQKKILELGLIWQKMEERLLRLYRDLCS